MRGQVRNTPHGVALHFHVGAQHLPDERLETAKLYDEQLVVGCHAKSATSKKYAWSIRTIYSEISQRRTGSPLHFGVMAAEEEEDGVERVAANRANFLLGNFGKCKCGAALEVDVVRKRECSQRCKRRIPEEVGSGTICSSATP